MIDAPPTSLTDFLLARIAEDEAALGDSEFDQPHWSGCNYFVPDHMVSEWGCDCDYVARVRADLAAKLAIVDAASDRLGGPNWRDAIDYALRELAAIYADHPDYRDEWRIRTAPAVS